MGRQTQQYFNVTSPSSRRDNSKLQFEINSSTAKILDPIAFKSI